MTENDTTVIIASVIVLQIPARPATQKDSCGSPFVYNKRLMKEGALVDKPFMTYEQQLDKLINEKGLEIKDRNYAVKLLKNYSYFDLISGYKNPFKDRKGKYKLHTSIEDIYALYCFDDKIRTIFFRYILKIEKKIKSLISYSFCEQNGEDQAHFLNATKYNYTAQNQDEVNDLIHRIIHT